jgi:hypothetical protein
MILEKFNEVIIPLFIQHFNLIDETTDSLLNQIEIEMLTNQRVRISKKVTFPNLTKIANEGVHKAIKKALTNYADETALMKYMEKEGWMYEPKITLDTILASNFIIFHNNNYEQTLNFVRNRYKTQYDYWEFEKLNDEYSIAYN